MTEREAEQSLKQLKKYLFQMKAIIYGTIFVCVLIPILTIVYYDEILYLVCLSFKSEIW